MSKQNGNRKWNPRCLLEDEAGSDVIPGGSREQYGERCHQYVKNVMEDHVTCSNPVVQTVSEIQCFPQEEVEPQKGAQMSRVLVPDALVRT